MAELLRITALDSVMDLTIDAPPDSPFSQAVTRAWSRCTTPAPASQNAEPLTATSPEGPTAEHLHFTLQHLTQEITHNLIASQSGRLIMLHAGAVSHPATGASLVFVASGGTGKTTLARTLGRSYGYITDETAGIHPAGRIQTYPKPLSLRFPAGGPKRETSPDDLGLLHSHPSPFVARIVLLTRPAEHDGPPHVEELGTLDAITALIPETSALNKLPGPLHLLADLLDRTGPVLRVHYHEAADLLPLASDLIGAP